MLFHPAALPLSRRPLNLAARTIRAHREDTRSRWRRPHPAQQALLVLVHLYKGEPFAQITAGFGGHHDRLAHACTRPRPCSPSGCPPWDRGCAAHDVVGAYVIVDGTLIGCDRVAADRPFHSGKHQRHGMSIQVAAAPDGEPLWTSWSLLGSVHDVRAARVWRIAERIAAARLPGLGDKRYVGLSQVVFYPFKGREKPQWKKD
ncbi:transposase family protein [Nocardiopsis sp. EMB25]|uniref:transposase family protein n=1 Tax=Nocardiopsis sp. EMB25 TaxID=2835867 RepID=UPI0022849E48|nr:transposase family protein [Nocardiopsis sp. EMB25]MCY9784283.1 transposase family protein [Nocardiopsis sp. EMB25]